MNIVGRLENSARRAVALATLVTLPVLTAGAAGCAAPPPEDESGAASSSSDALDEAGKLTYAAPALNSQTNVVTVNVRFDRPKQKAQYCRAYLDGTDAQGHACDTFPTGYVDMTCVDSPDRTDSRRLYTECRDSAKLGDAPYDKGDGRYGVFIVNKGNSSDKASGEISLYSSRLVLTVLGRDLPDRQDTFLATGEFAIQPGTVTKIINGLHLGVQVSAPLVGEVVGCATGYSATGLSETTIAEKDAEQIALCQSPTARLDGRDGWRTTDGPPGLGLKVLRYDASPLIAKGFRVFFSFAVSGRVNTYVFAS